MSEVSTHVMSEQDAHRLTERIRYTAMSVRDGLEKLQRLVSDAQEGQAHVALGYQSWTAYIADVFSEAPLQLQRQERREVVAWLSGEGMSTRAIAPIVGSNRETVRQEIAAAGDKKLSPGVGGFDENGERQTWANPKWFPDGLPEPDEARPSESELMAGTEWTPEPEPSPTPITGMDGKTYTRPQPKETPKPKAEAITSQFSSVIVDLNRVLDRLHRISTNDNFQRNKSQIETLHGNDLARAISELQVLANQLN